MISINTNEYIKVSPSAFCVDGDIVWIVHATLNIFFSYDLTNGNTKVYSLSPYGEPYRQAQFCGIHAYNGKVFFVPCYSQQVLCFDCKTEIISIVEENTVLGRFACSYKKNNYLYCVPYHEDYFLKIDMNTKEIKYINWRGLLCSDSEYINSAFEYDGKIIGMTSHEDCVIVLENDNVRYVLTKTEHEVFSTGCVFCNEIFLYSKSTKRVLRFKSLLDSPVEIFPMIKGGGAIRAIGNQYLLMENIDLNGSIWINVNGEWKSVFEDNEAKKGLDYSYNHGLVYSYKERDFYYNRRKNTLSEYQNGEAINDYDIVFSNKIIKDTFLIMFNKKKIISEIDGFRLQELIDLV